MLSYVVHPAATVPKISSHVAIRCLKQNSLPVLVNLSCSKPLSHTLSNDQHLHIPRVALVPNSINVENTNKQFWIYQMELEVRDYELDQFGVVNHATYVSYCEHGRLKALSAITGISANMISESGGALAVMELSVKYFAPLRSGDRFLEKIRVSGWSKTRLYVDHYIVKLPNEEPIMKANTINVWLDKNYRPVSIPSQVIADILKVSNSDEN